MDYKKYHPVRTISLFGHVVLKALRFLYWCRKMLGRPQWDSPIPSHHENPLTMTTTEQMFLGYKYYYKAIVKPEPGSGLVDYFASQQLAPSIPANFIPEKTIRIGAAGDLIPYKYVHPNHCRELWNEAGDFLFNNDIVFANLETVADPAQKYSAAPEIMLHDMYFNIHEESFSVFSGNGRFKGYDVLSIANNHSLDMGEAGVQATIEFLRSKNIAYCGSSPTEAERDDFPILERNGIRIAFLAYTFCLNKESNPPGKEWLCNHILLNEPDPDISLIIHQANLAREKGADLVVASLHMGCAYQAYPSVHTVNNMHLICREANIDILLGGHPHNLQPMEIYKSQQPGGTALKEHFIVYSLADFIAYDIFKWCHLTMILQLTIAKGHVDGRPHVQLTQIKARPFYMHLDKNEDLRLLDFLRIMKNPEVHFADKATINEVKELADFFQSFIITKNQEHILAT